MAERLATAPDAAEEAPAPRPGPGAFRRLAELFALTGFAVVQPLLDVTGRAPDFFLYRRANTNEMRLFVLLVVLAPPLLLWSVELVVGVFGKAAARAVHLVLCAGLFAVVVIRLGKLMGLFTGVPLALVAAAAGVGLAVLLARTPAFRQFVRYATPAPLVFALIFTFTAPAGALVRGTEIDRGEGRFVANRPPVVYLFLDEFPLRALLDENGRIDERIYPNFARLQKMSNWYPNATGVTGWTPFAAPAMLRGKFPERAVAASYIEYPENLFTWLSGSYRMRAYETIAEMCPPGMCLGVAAGRATGMRALTRDTVDLTKDIVSPFPSRENVTEQFVENGIERAREQAAGQPTPDAQERFPLAGLNQPERFPPFLDELKPQPEPNLHFMHLLLPHAPWRYLPSGATYERIPTAFPLDRHKEVQGDGKPRQTTPNEPLATVIAKQRLVLQTAYTDNLIGVMLDRMTETGLLDQALLIVTADHGTGIEPNTRSRQMDDTNPADIAWVPLFVKAPGQREGKVDDRNAMHVDLVPTIADVLGSDPPWQMDGQSLLGPPRAEQRKTWFDVPGHPEYIDPARWRDKVGLGYAAEIAQPARGRSPGLFAVGPHGDLVGRKVADLTVGAPSPATANLMDRVDLEVDLGSGQVPAMIYGDLDRPLGSESTWLVASVDGTVAGAIAAVPADGTWRFLGLLDEKAFTKDGPADVALYTVDGTTLHPLKLLP